MSGQGVRWTAEEVLALAPDEASRRAGSRLSLPGPWSGAGSGAGAVWGLCEGSGSKPYRTAVDLGGTGRGPVGGADGQGTALAGRVNAPGYKCSCPSRKSPCKHALGLLLLWAGEHPPPEEAPPDWAGEWLSGRRERAARAAAEEADGEGPGGADTVPAAGSGAGGARRADGKATRRRAGQRMLRVTAGATELEERLGDLLRGGLAGAEQDDAGWQETASRMIDAQAPGLAARVRELGAVPVPGLVSDQSDGAFGGRAARLLSDCALLHLLNRGLLALDGLPAPLAATVRTGAGLTVGSSELLSADSDAEKVRDEWLVLAQRDTEEGRLTARRIWLRGLRTGLPALLLSYAAGGRTHQQAFPVGSVAEAELAFHPGARPLRAALGDMGDTCGAPSAGPEPDGGTVTEALASYGQALSDDPWLEAWPAVLSGVVPVFGHCDEGHEGIGRGDGGGRGAVRGGVADTGPGVRQVADADGESALPVAPGVPSTALWKLAAISGGHPVTVFGECGHRGFAPYTAWSAGEAVPL